ncbi:hypothetical protein [Paraburkholderia adhaesiva]|uniref:hypothetical protein n=1 Tax=Paraburkholderia adhaesiva TaxID=2883244 RepID=UPI001F34B243|nr:hypothetical protein [Paraburkholderia adhaesiva]
MSDSYISDYIAAIGNADGPGGLVSRAVTPFPMSVAAQAQFGSRVPGDSRRNTTSDTVDIV